MRKRRGQVIDGVVLINKPVDWSSNQVLQRVKRVIDAQKAGHTGTLDPFATGLLICCLGRGTKLAGQMLDADKQYIATLKLGQETDSGDLTGEVTADLTGQFSVPTKVELEAVLQKFVGTIEQVPPMTSALKHKGRPLYEYARKGVEIERAPREVTIHRLELIESDGLTAKIKVDCSKGTYVRTLAQDIGRVLGTKAHLVALERTRIGPFLVEDAWTLERLESLQAPTEAVLSLDHLPRAFRLPMVLQPS